MKMLCLFFLRQESYHFVVLLFATVFLLFINAQFLHEVYSGDNEHSQLKSENDDELNLFLSKADSLKDSFIKYRSKQQKLRAEVYQRFPHLRKRKNSDDRPSLCDVIIPEKRFNCLPTTNLNQKKCEAINCCWIKNSNAFTSVIPQCYFSKNSLRYRLKNIKNTSSEISALLTLNQSSGIPNEIFKLKLMIKFCDKSRFRLIITDFNSVRYQVPESFLSSPCSSVISDSAFYSIQLFPNGTLNIFRRNSKVVLFKTDLSTLLFADQFLQLSSFLPSHYIYGLGDHMAPLLKSTNWTKYTFFNRDQIPEENMNLYSSFPFYMVMEEDGLSHGVYLLNSNAMDIILQPAPAITFRSVGGIFDFLFFLGPTPNEVVQQFSEMIGNPAMPPYWSLGFHLSRLGYFTLNKTIEVCNRTIQAGIPLDTQWNDIDYMDRYNDFTYDKENFKGLPGFVQSLHKMGMHYILIIDPGISNAEPPGTYPPYEEGLAMGIFIKNSSGQLLTTKVWNKVSSVFPDFTNRRAEDYWGKQLTDFHSIIPFDGVWLDMNEPTNFLNGSFDGCPKDSFLEHPPYIPGDDNLFTKTICMTACHNISNHYNIHNIYGTYETEATFRSLSQIRKKRPFVLTRAGFPGMGRFAAMWNGDVISVWEHMRYSIPSLLGFSIVGIPMVGSDICGFNNNTSVELCARWMSLGAFYPFSRNHNSDENIEQDPVALGPKVVAAAKSSLKARYYLLPYLYTLLFFSHTTGMTVMRPLFFEFPKDRISYENDKQFLWGSALMIIPVLNSGVTQIQGYFPPDVWYDFYTGRKLKSIGQNYTLDAPIDRINLFLRSGHILPAQDPGQTTTTSRKNDFTLLVALNVGGAAQGSLYWDDGDAEDIDTHINYNLIEFTVTERLLRSRVKVSGYKTKMTLGTIKVYGVLQKPKHVLVDGHQMEFTYNSSLELLEIPKLAISLLLNFTVNW